jgi:dihydrofolate synthase/folylpolyglutamate synthase
MENYQDTINFLFSQLPQYQKIGTTAYKSDLDNIMAMSYLLGNPHDKIKTVHVAGTNGKGSTSHMLASILQEAGYKVGLYTSPHIKDFRERIKINGNNIEKKEVVKFIEKNQPLFIDIKPSFFEWTVALAYHYFAKQTVDIAIIEVGLGGRLDSTNIIIPEVSVITNIGLDHTDVLGGTIAEIAIEKAGIIKEGIPVVIGETQEETTAVFIEKAKNNNATLYFADQLIEGTCVTDLRGDFQQKNYRAALQTCEVLIEKGWKITKKNIVSGLKNVTKNTNLLGRLQTIKKSPRVIVDVAHNKVGFNEALKTLKKTEYKNLHIVIGLSKDKNREDIYKLLPEDATYYFCAGTNERLLNALDLRFEAVMHNLHGNEYSDAKKGLERALDKAKKKDLILVIGSFFIAEQVL